jgi:UDP-galactopyranose mutase
MHNKFLLHNSYLFKSQVKNLFNTTIKTLINDGGTKYMPILINHPHIKYQLTCSYTPQQNHVAQCKYRYIIELSLAIISHTSLPISY